MTAPARTIPACPDCYSDLEVELAGFWCRACAHVVPFEWAIYMQDGDNDD